VGDSLRSTVVIRRAPNSDDRWLLIASPAGGVWVNGQRIGAGLHALRDKDEIRLPGSKPIFFSTEALACVAPFPGLARAANCPRCRQVIVPGIPAVRCPACQTWHHESPPCNCWTYSTTCAACAQLTPLGTDFRWRPEEIAS
jgi:hypothetical protein